MDVTVEVVEGLTRRMKVQLPARDVQSQVETRLQSLARRVRVDGFRPGKAPLKLVRSQYADSVREEVMQSVVQSTYGQALQRQQLRPAGPPSLEDRALDEAAGFSYTVTFEVYPEISLQLMDQIKVQRPVASVEDADLDRMVENLRQQRRRFQPAADRAAQTGDRVTLDFHGTLDGAEFEGNSGKDVKVELGSGRMLKDFDAAVQGMKADESKDFDLSFPVDYAAAHLAGKTARFNVRLKQVEEKVLPEIDEGFVRAFGVASGQVEDFRREVRDNMNRELKQAVRARIKRQALDQLLAHNPVTLPNALVQEEIGRMREQALHEMPALRQHPGALADGMFEEGARRRVGLGLLVGEVIKQQKIELDKARVQEAIQEIASTYENPKEVEGLYAQRKDLRAGVEALVLEDQVVDWLMGQAQVEDQPQGFYDLVSPQPATA
jgi:trigger factor